MTIAFVSDSWLTAFSEKEEAKGSKGMSLGMLYPAVA